MCFSSDSLPVFPFVGLVMITVRDLCVINLLADGRNISSGSCNVVLKANYNNYIIITIRN